MKGRNSSLLFGLFYCCLFLTATAQDTPGRLGVEKNTHLTVKDSFTYLASDSHPHASAISYAFDFPKTDFPSKTITWSENGWPGFDSIANEKAYPAAVEYRDRHALNFTSVLIPAAGISYGLVALHKDALRTLDVSTKNEIEEDHPRFHTSLDNYLQWSPAAAVIGLNIAGIKGEHCFADELAVYAVSAVIMGGAVEGLKHLTHEQRPDKSSYNSFPSGHTATAFAAAEWLRTEYWHRSPWIGVAGYTVAASVGVLRVYNNRHWVSDVVSGAAIGFLSTRIAYALNPWIEKHVFHVREQR